jgi:hypothetical protein
VFENKNLYGVLGKSPNYSSLICLWYNSSFGALLTELAGRISLGQGVLDIDVWMIANTFIVNPDKLSEKLRKEAEEILSKIGKVTVKPIHEEMPIESIKEIRLDAISERRKIIDSYIGKILDLEEKEQLEIYKGLSDLIRTRIEKAKTVARRKKKKGVDVEALADGIVSKLNTKIERFPDAYLSDYKGLWSTEIKIPTGQPVLGSDINGFYVRVREEEVYRGWDQEEAKFIYFAALTGRLSVRIPLDKQAAASAVKSFEEEYKKLKEEVDKLLLTLIADAKIRKDVEEKVWKKIFQSLR